MAVHSINDVNYDEATSKVVVDEEVQGQPQAKPRPLDDGKVQVAETHIALDTQVLDPNHELAVQIPEGVGATSTDRPNPLADAFSSGTAEEQFAVSAREARESNETTLPESADSVRKNKAPAKKD